MWTVEIGAVPGECMYEVTGWLTKHHDASTWPCKVETNLKNGFIERASSMYDEDGIKKIINIKTSFFKSYQNENKAFMDRRIKDCSLSIKSLDRMLMPVYVWWKSYSKKTSVNKRLISRSLLIKMVIEDSFQMRGVLWRTPDWSVWL